VELLLSKSFKGAGLYLPPFLFVFFLIFISCSSTQVRQHQIKTTDSAWQFIAVSEDGKYEIYVNQISLKRLRPNEVFAEVKLYPSQVEREKIKRDFEELEKQAQQEFCTRVNGTERLLYEMYNLKSHYFQYKALCNEKKIEVLGTGIIKFFIEIRPNSPAEKIYNYLCSFK
jgi:Txe/YoeB family toxin of Txe-Axe toxin-antitoxin module